MTNTPAACYENLWNPEVITFEYPRYDKVGNRLSMRVDAGPNQVYEYDKLYQLTEADYNDGRIITYDYDKLGNRDDVNGSGVHTGYSHNAMNQYTQVASKSFEYDKNGNLIDDGYTSYTYDYENRLLSSTCDTLNPAHLGPDLVTNGTFTGSANGWTLGSGDNGGWLYEDNHVEFGSYQTNADLEQTIAGLQADRTYRITYDVLYVYTPYGTSSIGIELGGAGTDDVTLSTGTQTRYVTTANSTGKLKFKGQTTGLIEIDFDNIKVEMVTAANVTYAYDYKGRRIRKTVTQVYGTAGSTTTTFAYDGDQVIAEYDGEGTLLRKFIYGPGIDEPICMSVVLGPGSEVTYYYHYDGLGSVVALSNPSGELIEKYEYNAFGEPNRTSSVGNPYFFTGRRYDSETENYYYRYRYYSAETGRFLQPDPIGYYGGLNLYAYVGNNPIVRRDPYGLTPRLDLAPFPPRPTPPLPTIRWEEIFDETFWDAVSLRMSPEMQPGYIATQWIIENYDWDAFAKTIEIGLGAVLPDPLGVFTPDVIGENEDAEIWEKIQEGKGKKPEEESDS